MLPCTLFLDAHQSRLQEAAGEGEFLTRHEAFLRELAACAAGYFEPLPPRDRERRPVFFRACHLRYLFLREQALALRRQAQDPLPPAAELLQELFGKEAIPRVRALNHAAAGCRRAVMVGCGPLPALGLWLLQQNPELTVTGLEVREDALIVAQRLIRGAHPGRLTLAQTDGAHFDYAGADLVYVANQVAPKRRVLERIAGTAPSATVIVRDPIGPGWFLAEPVADSLPAPYAIMKTGAESMVFLSRDLVLQVQPHGANSKVNPGS
jgi:hypothetical protein